MRIQSIKDLLMQLVIDMSEVKKDMAEVKTRLTNSESEVKNHGWNV